MKRPIKCCLHVYETKDAKLMPVHFGACRFRFVDRAAVVSCGREIGDVVESGDCDRRCRPSRFCPAPGRPGHTEQDGRLWLGLVDRSCPPIATQRSRRVTPVDAPLFDRLCPSRQPAVRRNQPGMAEAIEQVCRQAGVSSRELQAGSRRRQVSKIRALLAQRQVSEFGLPLAAVARPSGVSVSAVAKSLQSLQNRQTE